MRPGVRMASTSSAMAEFGTTSRAVKRGKVAGGWVQSRGNPSPPLFPCSGRPGWRGKCEHYLSIDVRRWARMRYLSDTGYFLWSWTINGDQHCSVRFWVREYSIEADYKRTLTGTPYTSSGHPASLAGSASGFNGCGRRSAKLYLGSRYFACRHCLNLAYQSQCYSPYDRALTRS